MRLFNESRSRADAMLLDDAEKSLACLAGYGRGAPSLPRCSGVDLAGVRVPNAAQGSASPPSRRRSARQSAVCGAVAHWDRESHLLTLRPS